MASRGSLVCVAVLCAALSAAVVAGDAVEPLGSIVETSGQGEYLAGAQGGRKLLNDHDRHHNDHFTPGWVTHDGNVFAQANFYSGNTVQVGGKGDGHQQANSAAYNNAQINKDSIGNGVLSQNNIISGRKLLVESAPPRNSSTPAWIKDGKVYVFQGNLFSGNTVQAGNPHRNQTSDGHQQANSAAFNNAQINNNSLGNGGLTQNNINSSGRKLLGATSTPNNSTTPHNTSTPAWIKDGKVYVFQGNLFSGNTVQAGNPHRNQTSNGYQQANSAAFNNAQINNNSVGNGQLSQNNINSDSGGIIVMRP